jgi:hypothetical protein
MRKWRGILFGLLVGVVIGGLVWLAWWPREPVYLGRRLSAWLQDLPTDMDVVLAQVPPAAGQSAVVSNSNRLDPAREARRVREAIDDKEIREQVKNRELAAIGAMRWIGTNALPLLIHHICDKDYPKEEPNEVQRFRMRMFDDSSIPADRRSRAVFAVHLLGPMAAPAIPEFTKALGDWETSYYAARALAAIGPQGWEVLRAAAAKPNFVVENASNALAAEHVAAGAITNRGSVSITSPINSK